MKNVGYWWNSKSIDLVEIEGKVYALCGWNGEKYTDCWMCAGEGNRDASEDKYELTPVYKTKEDECEIVDYTVSRIY